jgi:hypothetical protein
MTYKNINTVKQYFKSENKEAFRIFQMANSHEQSDGSLNAFLTHLKKGKAKEQVFDFGNHGDYFYIIMDG